MSIGLHDSQRFGHTRGKLGCVKRDRREKYVQDVKVVAELEVWSKQNVFPLQLCHTTGVQDSNEYTE